MHYNARIFKPDKRPPILEFRVNELFQFCPHCRRNLHPVTTELPGDVDGLTVGAQELNAWRAIAKMVVEPALCLRFEGPLHIIKQQPFDVATAEHRSKELLKRIHLQVGCRGIEERFT